MTGSVPVLVEDYIGLRRGLGYRSVTQERALRAFARYLEGHEGPIPLESTLNWTTSTSSTDPRNPARRLATVRGFLRHLHALDGGTEVPAAGMLGPTGQRTPPHVYSDGEIADLLAAAGRLSPAGGLQPHCYATLFGLLACTGLRISEALALSCADVDLDTGVVTVRAGKRGLTRLVPLHDSAVGPLRDFAFERERRHGRAGPQDAFFRTESSERLSYNTASHTFRCFAGSWAEAPPAAPAPRGCTTCGTGWWCGASRPGTPKEWTSTPRSLRWPPTWAMWRCATSTGISPPSPS
jgi:site-specific recombinase XerD